MNSNSFKTLERWSRVVGYLFMLIGALTVFSGIFSPLSGGVTKLAMGAFIGGLGIAVRIWTKQMCSTSDLLNDSVAEQRLRRYALVFKVIGISIATILGTILAFYLFITALSLYIIALHLLA